MRSPGCWFFLRSTSLNQSSLILPSVSTLSFMTDALLFSNVISSIERSCDRCFRLGEEWWRRLVENLGLGAGSWGRLGEE